MLSKATLLAVLAALAEARFGQENVPIGAISAVQGGDPGAAATIAGQAVSDLLAGANACAKLQRGDQILEELGNGADALAAAIGMVAAEKNFNPFVEDLPTICSDPTLPANPALRGITPLVDPAVGGADVANALSAQTQAAPLEAAGLSVADLLAANGFTNFTTQDLAGNKGAAPGAAAGAGAAVAAAANNNVAAAAPAAAANNQAAACAAQAAGANVAAAAAPAVAANNNAAAGQAQAAAGNNAAGVQASSIAGLDFGLCVPTIKFEGGLGGRPATEFTFQAIDELVATGQQEALNPNIITNRICDQLTNVCEANDAAKTACEDAQAQIQALNTRDKTTADTWNTALGFAGTVTNPSGGPAEPPAARRSRKVRRSSSFYA